MILTDKDIRAEIEKAPSFIQPFDQRRLNGSSYDVALGSVIHEIGASSGVVYLSDQERIDSLYIERDIANGYILKPGQYVLCSVEESITLPDDVVARIMPRTRFTRMGLLVANQFCNASYSGQLQLGVRNVSPNNISIVEGLAIAQIVFERLESAPSEDRLYRVQSSAAYQGERADEFRGARFGDDELTDRVKGILSQLSSD